MFPSHGAPSPDMQDDPRQSGPSAGGDGLHHHQIDQDEGGGFHSVHTHPDGRQEPAEHADYQEASDHMDQSFGQSGEQDEPDGDESGSDFGDSDTEDVAGAYGRKACG